MSSDIGDSQKSIYSEAERGSIWADSKAARDYFVDSVAHAKCGTPQPTVSAAQLL